MQYNDEFIHGLILQNKSEILGEILDLELVRKPDFKNQVLDSTSVYKFHDKAGKRNLVLIISATDFPYAIATAIAKLYSIKASLSESISHRILVPLSYGSFNNITYGIWSQKQSITNNKILARIQKRMINQSVMWWLFQFSIQTKIQIIDNEDRYKYFLEPLSFLNNCKEISKRLPKLAPDAYAILDSKEHLHTVSQHGDVWHGNILLENQIPADKKWYLIDWGAANERGYPYIDILQFLFRGYSIKNSRHIINIYSEKTGFQKCDIPLYIAAYGGYLVENRGEFPLKKLINQLEILLRYAEY